MQLLRAPLALLTPPLLLAAAPWMADLGFQPSEGSRVTRDYSIAVEFELGDLTMLLDGQDLSEMMPGNFEGNGTLKLQIEDHFVRSGGGRALELIRTFATIDASFEAAGESQDMKGAEDLEGKSVRFLWNDDEDDYDVAYHECEGEESTLQAISADMDLSVLLPGRAVEVGDVWTVEAAQIGSVLLFGGKLEDDGPDEMGELLMNELEPQLAKLLETFKISCEYKGEREQAGAKLGVIAVDLVGEGELDLEPVILAMLQSQELPIPVELTFDAATLELSFSGKGELLWNLQRGLLHAFDLGADLELAVEVDVAVDAQGQSHEVQAEIEILGRGTWKVRTPAGE